MMLPDPPLLAAFAIAAILLILTPGPDVLYVSARAIGQGRAAGLIAAAGISVGLLVHIAAAALGLSSLFAHAPLLYEALRLAGIAYLLWLAWRTLRGGDEVRVAGDGQRLAAATIFRQALLTNLLNPKIIVFFVSFLPQFAQPAKGDLAWQIAALGLLFVTAGLAFLALLSVAFGRAGDWLRHRPRFWRAQRWVSGGLLGGMALWLALPDRR